MKMLKIQLGLNSIKPIEEKSHYNCNYYELEPYGDWCIFFKEKEGHIITASMY